MITDNEKVDAKDHLESETIDEHEKRENSESLQDEGIATASDSDAGELEDIDTQAQDIEEEQLRLKFEEVTQQYLLARAEAENIRKRADIEISNARKFALESFVRELLSVKDSLDLAKSIDLSADTSDLTLVKKVVEGIDLTIKQLESVFARFNIEEVNPDLGDKLDPERHQAMSTEETLEFQPSLICKVIQKGYLLHNRLLRPAMVIVAKKPMDT
ncbi:MAG: nucleotide exchange factor GrpE [Acidiferrobacteraceae bacterium]|nr:nucleotide exchange factor GrpE [Acidiferrobacteraceae bacterium]|tara:strand:+ start:11971 stop:12618 length:648 start_codon:yes stop_codon:yes gene_type:complete